MQVFESALSLGAGESAMLLNGIPVEMEVYDVYTLLDLMKSEARLMEGLFSLGFKVRTLCHTDSSLWIGTVLGFAQTCLHNDQI